MLVLKKKKGREDNINNRKVARCGFVCVCRHERFQCVFICTHSIQPHRSSPSFASLFFLRCCVLLGFREKEEEEKKMKMREFVFSFPHRSSVNNELSFPLCVLLYTFDGKVYVNIIYYISRAEL